MEYYEKTPFDHQAVLIDTDYLDAVFIIASMILLMSSVRWPRLISQAVHGKNLSERQA